MLPPLTEVFSSLLGSSLIYISGLSKLDTSNIKIMSSMFKKCSSLKIIDLFPWTSNNVYDINNMFSGCCSLLSIPDISQWDISNVINMNGLF